MQSLVTASGRPRRTCVQIWQLRQEQNTSNNTNLDVGAGKHQPQALHVMMLAQGLTTWPYHMRFMTPCSNANPCCTAGDPNTMIYCPSTVTVCFVLHVLMHTWAGPGFGPGFGPARACNQPIRQPEAPIRQPGFNPRNCRACDMRATHLLKLLLKLHCTPSSIRDFVTQLRCLTRARLPHVRHRHMHACGSAPCQILCCADMNQIWHMH